MLKSDKTPCLLVVFWGETKGKAALCRFQIVKTCCGAVFVILAGGWGENLWIFLTIYHMVIMAPKNILDLKLK